MSLTIAEINSLNIDLAFWQSKIKTKINQQRTHTFFAFGIFDAPSERAEKESFAEYWKIEEEIQTALSKIQKIKEKLR